jgi:hypothetical protein
LKYNDYYVDYDTNLKQSSSVSRLFNSQISRPRYLYILPFLSAHTTNVYPSALASPLSSAPNTVTPCRLKNLNVQIAGQNIFNEPQNFNYSFYNNNALSLIADVNGNSPKGSMFSGQITKSHWENGYGVYYINLEKVTDLISDSLMKSFQLMYQIEGTNTGNNGALTISYDMYYIITYENELNLDRLTGSITNIGQ